MLKTQNSHFDMDMTNTKCQDILSNSKSSENEKIDHDQENTFSIDDAVNKVGYGKFQIRLTCLAGLGWFADAAEIFILSVIGEYISCDWSLQRWQIALLTSVVFAGIMVGSPVFGFVADKFGRKKSISASITLVLVFGAVSAASPSYLWLLVLRTITGFALGGVSQGLTLLSEYCPTEMRGKTGFYLCYFWSLGTVGVVLLAWVVMDYLNNWRILLALTAVPALSVVASLKWYPESPRYFLVSHQHLKAVKELQIMAKENHCDLPPGKLANFNVNTSRGNLLDLLSVEYRRTTLLFWYIWFSTGFTYYGIALLTPIIIQNGGIVTPKEINSTGPTGLTNLVLPCKEFSKQDYIEMLWTSSAEFPALLLFTFLIEYCSRKALLGGAFLASSISILLLLWKTNKIVLLIFLFCARGILCAIFQLSYIMTSEVFPTTVRALAMGTGSGSSKLGGLVVPYVAQVLLVEYPVMAICILAIFTTIAVLAVAFIPETKGKNLKESVSQIT